MYVAISTVKCHFVVVVDVAGIFHLLNIFFRGKLHLIFCVREVHNITNLILYFVTEATEGINLILYFVTEPTDGINLTVLCHKSNRRY